MDSSADLRPRSAIVSERLSVNLAPDVAATLRELAQRNGSSLTEEVRRSISVLKFIEDQRRAGGRVLVEQGESLFEVKWPGASA